MDWNGAAGFVIAGAAGLFAISLMFWSGHVLLAGLGNDALPESMLAQHPVEQPAHEGLIYSPVLAGQERLATQPERDDVNGTIKGLPSTPVSEPLPL